jgi:hypothetical protein
MMGHHEAWRLLPDMAADVCEEDDRAAVEAHLSTCEACRAELESLRSAVAILSGAPPLLDPPSSLRDRVLAIPGTDEAPAGAPRRSRPRPAPRARRRRRPIWAPLAAGLAVAALALVAVLAWPSSGGFDSRRSVSLGPPPSGPQGAGGVAQWGNAHNGNISLRLRVWKVPPHTGASTYYEVWLGKGKDGRQSVGTFAVPQSGKVTVTFQMPQAITKEYAWIWVTREKDDGNPKPSNNTVLFGDL